MTTVLQVLTALSIWICTSCVLAVSVNLCKALQKYIGSAK